jgi:hypothetical protein
MRQDIDIVDRLRIIWTSMTDMGNAERLEASEEILRLRNELTERIHMCDMRSEKILELTAERDEARQMFCNAMTDHCEEDEARQIAKEQGFKEDVK